MKEKTNFQSVRESFSPLVAYVKALLAERIAYHSLSHFNRKLQCLLWGCHVTDQHKLVQDSEVTGKCMIFTSIHLKSVACIPAQCLAEPHFAAGKAVSLFGYVSTSWRPLETKIFAHLF
ncbi:hypothetical protein CRENBAI_019339 [Crenichthys baileyi]|uniref:CST complex subunit CTC1 n=1 Tax=Crenichthys baileyi TaxID=28760 RepID=A0AAV9SPA7_9TELE